jgi:thiol-disulfide isomerase/thioredoxin
MKKLFFLLCGLLLIISSFSFASEPKKYYPVAGEKCPSFKLNNIKYFTYKKASLNTFKDKWLIIDVWDKHCGTCIASLPKMDSLQKKFSSTLQIIMVAPDDKENELLFDKYRDKMNLQIPSAFDSKFLNNFDIESLPFIIVIDPKGIIRGVTYKVNSNDISDFLAGRSPQLPKTYSKTEQSEQKRKYNYRLPFLVNGNGGEETDFMYRSLLSKANQYADGFPGKVELDEFGKFEILGIDLNCLYMYAYTGKYPYWGPRDSLYGKFWPKLILNISDTDKLKYTNEVNPDLYSYSLIVPKEKGKNSFLMSVMQSDLEKYFGYKVSVEIRKMPCWNLVILNEKSMKLKTNGGPFYSSPGKTSAGFSVRNYPMKNFLSCLPNVGIPFYDETGITGNIDITMDCIMTDIDQVRKGLQANGLDLIEGEKEMKVVVISEYLQ